ncbi:hypothetical protein [Metabacillus sp. RGM 3146]|uniref:hypothetical protein n=1 Tax=Metabacillus sp. RGM 3146 TaxID=3401092 RepID=UPI003B9DA4DE
MRGQNKRTGTNPFTAIRQEDTFSGDSLTLSLKANYLKVSWSISSLTMKSCMHFLFEEYETVHKVIRIIHADRLGELLYKDYPIKNHNGSYLIKGLEGNCSYRGQTLFFNSKDIKLTIAQSTEVRTGTLKHPYQKYGWNAVSAAEKWQETFSAYTEYEGDHEK